MKRLVLALTLSFFALSFVNVSEAVAQREKKELKKDVKAKATRQARKEAKKLKKEGWQTPAGSLPLDKLTEKAWEKQLDYDDNGNPLYITADGNTIAGNRNAAESQALNSAVVQLAEKLESKVAGLVSQNIANAELSAEEAESVSEMVKNTKTVIAAEIGYVDTFYKIYRRLSNGNVEVSVRIFYNSNQAEEMAKKAVRKELKTKLKTNEEDLKKLMGL